MEMKPGELMKAKHNYLIPTLQKVSRLPLERDNAY